MHRNMLDGRTFFAQPKKRHFREHVRFAHFQNKSNDDILSARAFIKTLLGDPKLSVSNAGHELCVNLYITRSLICLVCRDQC